MSDHQILQLKRELGYLSENVMETLTCLISLYQLLVSFSISSDESEDDICV